MTKTRLPIETVLFLRKAHRVVEDKRKKESKNECKNFKSKKNKMLKEIYQ